MKLNEFIYCFKLLLFGNKNKIRFMNELVSLTENNSMLLEFIKEVSCSNTEYLNELYMHWQSGGDILKKLNYDYEIRSK